MRLRGLRIHEMLPRFLFARSSFQTQATPCTMSLHDSGTEGKL